MIELEVLKKRAFLLPKSSRLENQMENGLIFNRIATRIDQFAFRQETLMTRNSHQRPWLNWRMVPYTAQRGLAETGAVYQVGTKRWA